MAAPSTGNTDTLFIPRVEPVFKKWRGEDAFGHAAGSSSSQIQRAAGASADTSLAGMRGREEEGASDESVAALHMAFMNCSDAVDRFTDFSRNKSCEAAVDSSSGGKGQHQLAVINAFETLDSTFCHFIDRFAPILQLTLCDEEATEDASLALAKKVSPESAGYNQQAKPALGSLLSVLVFLSTLHSNYHKEEEESDGESHQIELFLRELAMRSFEKFLKHAFGRREGGGHVHEHTKIIRLARFAFWLCNALEAGALWLTVSRKSNANKEKKAAELSHENVEETAAGDFAHGVFGHDAVTVTVAMESIEGIIGNFLSKAAVVVQTPICVQLQRFELLSWIVSIDSEWRKRKEGEGHVVHTQENSGDAQLHIGLLSRVCGFLLGHAGAEHHQHNARRNIAAWRHLARMLRHFRRSLACKKACVSPQKQSEMSQTDETGEQCRKYNSKSFIDYLEQRVITAFERRDRGVAAMANLFRRQLDNALVSYTGATMESLGLKETTSSASESANGSFAATNGGTQSSPTIGSSTPLSSNIEPKIHHQQGFHDRARKMAVSRPSSDELSAAKGVVLEAFFWPEQRPELFDSASARAFLEVVATFWLRPPCVAAA